MWSHGKYKALNMPFGSSYGHQNWESGNLQWGNPTFKVMWPFDYMVTWQIQKTYVCTSAIPMATKLGRVLTYVGRSQIHSQVTFWSRVHLTNVKPYICISAVSGHQTWQHSNLRWGNPTFKAKWPFDYVVTWEIEKTYTFTSAISVATKLGRVVTYTGGIRPLNSCNLLITRSCERWKTLQLSFHNS